LSFETVFVRKHVFGTLVGVKIPDGEPTSDDIARLHPDETIDLQRFKRTRRGTWVGGRLALTEACRQLGAPCSPILNSERGAPILPDGLAGSLTHKDDLAIALVSKSVASTHLGVDLEVISSKELGVAKMILTVEEFEEYESLQSHAQSAFLLVRFSLKEAIYKALDPFVQRYVGFKEARLTQDAEGCFHATLSLKNGEGPFEIELFSEALNLPGFETTLMVLSSARIRRG
jgi:enterobactin synthetase component D